MTVFHLALRTTLEVWCLLCGLAFVRILITIQTSLHYIPQKPLYNSTRALSSMFFSMLSTVNPKPRSILDSQPSTLNPKVKHSNAKTMGSSACTSEYGRSSTFTPLSRRQHSGFLGFRGCPFNFNGAKPRLLGEPGKLIILKVPGHYRGPG